MIEKANKFCEAPPPIGGDMYDLLVSMDVDIGPDSFASSSARPWWLGPMVNGRHEFQDCAISIKNVFGERVFKVLFCFQSPHFVTFAPLHPRPIPEPWDVEEPDWWTWEDRAMAKWQHDWVLESGTFVRWDDLPLAGGGRCMSSAM